MPRRRTFVHRITSTSPKVATATRSTNAVQAKAVASLRK